MTFAKHLVCWIGRMLSIPGVFAAVLLQPVFRPVPLRTQEAEKMTHQGDR